jgi:hypothetical protein
LALLALPAGALAAPGELDAMARDEIREEAHADILRTAPDVDVEPDVARVKRLMARPVRTAAKLPQEPLPEITLLVQPGGIEARRLLDLVAGMTGYRIENPEALLLSESVQITPSRRSLSRVLAAVESQARVAVSLYPEQKLIVVRRVRHATR